MAVITDYFTLNLKPMKNFADIKKDSVHIGGRIVHPEQIIMLVADINYTTIYLADGQRFMVATTIGKVQKILQLHGEFVRPNKSQVVNWAYVRSSTSKQLLLKNNEIVRFSRRREKSTNIINQINSIF